MISNLIYLILTITTSFIQPNYPYNLENSFGSLPSTSSEDNKPPQSLHIKEELGKELTSPDSLKQVNFCNIY